MILPSSLSLLKHDMVTLTRGLDHPEDTCKRKPPDAESEQIFEGPNPFIDHKMEDTGRPPPLKWISISKVVVFQCPPFYDQWKDLDLQKSVLIQHQVVFS